MAATKDHRAGAGTYRRKNFLTKNQDSDARSRDPLTKRKRSNAKPPRAWVATQLSEHQKASCKGIFTDKVSGAKADRPGLKETLSHLRETDTLVVWKLDRLGRSVKGLVDLVHELQKRDDFKSPTDGIDTKTPAGRRWNES